LLKFAIDKQLLRKPFVRLRKAYGQIIKLFLDTASYRQLKEYQPEALIQARKRVRIKAVVKRIQFHSVVAFDTVKLLAVDELSGKTYCRK
jgi:hypothetical protein